MVKRAAVATSEHLSDSKEDPGENNAADDDSDYSAAADT